MGVASAAWLGALATLAVPLAIHLWSRRRTTPVSIGSIRFLQSVKPVSARTFRLRQPLRLLLRVALLASLVLALAGPYLEGILARRTPERWLVLSSAVDVTTSTSLVDSLSSEADRTLTAPGDVWSFLVSLDETLPPGSSIDVVAPAATVRGSRPTIASRVNWFGVEPSGDSTGPVRGRRSRVHRSLTVLAGPDRWDDGRYLTAALQATVARDSSPATVRLLPTTSLDSVAATWIAWLSAQPPPTALVERIAAGGVLFTDLVGDHRQVATTVALPQPAELVRRGPTPSGVPVWRDGTGKMLLAAEAAGAGIRYRLATRLHPAWTDLVLRGSFPTALLPLVDNEPAQTAAPVTIAQVLPRQGATGVESRAADTTRSLFLPLWSLALVLFALDMVLLYRGRRVPV